MAGQASGVEGKLQAIAETTGRFANDFLKVKYYMHDSNLGNHNAFIRQTHVFLLRNSR